MDEKFLSDNNPGASDSNELNENLSFWEKILGFFRDDTPEAKKRKLLKDIQKILKKHKFKFINVKVEEAQPALAKFYYQMYRVIAIPSSLLLDQEKSPALKYLFIDSVLSEKQKTLISRLHKDSVEKRLVEGDGSVVEQIKKELAFLLKSISDEQKEDIVRIYRQYLVFLKLIKFDYYFFLRKFDSGFAEMDFKYKPAFQPINCDYIVDDLIDSSSIFPLLLRYDSWKEVFEVLKVFKGQDVLSRDDWNKLLKVISSINNSEVITYIIKLITRDPFYTPSTEEKVDDIVEEYFGKLKTSVAMTIQKVANEKKNNRKEAVLNQIFGTTAISRMKNYTEASNSVFRGKMLGGYLYIDIMNYMKAFMLDYVKKDLMRIINFLVVKAEWKTNIFSKELSDALEELIAVSDRILEFDQSLAADEDVGAKMNTFLKRMTSDPRYKGEIKKLLHDINSKVIVIAQDAHRNLVKIAQKLAEILPDFTEPPKMGIIINPAFVKSAYGNDIEADIKTIYKQIYHFLSLIKLMLSK
ncbi:MAG: DUF5312 family protein [Spirochaetia bacterium]|jgi:hypothetical protein|nr:DUF5312 family protein [Spirochaetia bacterium]